MMFRCVLKNSGHPIGFSKVIFNKILFKFIFLSINQLKTLRFVHFSTRNVLEQQTTIIKLSFCERKIGFRLILGDAFSITST